MSEYKLSFWQLKNGPFVTRKIPKGKFLVQKQKKNKMKNKIVKSFPKYAIAMFH